MKQNWAGEKVRKEQPMSSFGGGKVKPTWQFSQVLLVCWPVCQWLCAATHEAPVGEGGVCALAGAVGGSRGPGFLCLSSSCFAQGATFLEARIPGCQILP